MMAAAHGRGDTSRGDDREVTLASARTSAAAATAVLVSAVFGGCAGGPARAGEAPDLSGIWWASEYHAGIEPLGGGLPLTEAGKAAWETNAAGLADGAIADAARRFCVPDGVPRVLATPYPFEIVQAPPGQVTILYELNHQIRTVVLDRPFDDNALMTFPWFNGHSIGRYEGDTLVIETAGFNDRTFLDATGAPHTGDLRTTERLRRIGETQLEDVVTVTDPEYYRTPWQARFVYTRRSDVRIEDYVCGEPHRDLSAVAGVRRR